MTIGDTAAVVDPYESAQCCIIGIKVALTLDLLQKLPSRDWACAIPIRSQSKLFWSSTYDQTRSERKADSQHKSFQATIPSLTWKAGAIDQSHDEVGPIVLAEWKAPCEFAVLQVAPDIVVDAAEI